MKKSALAVVLMCVLSTPLLAGNMPTTGVVGNMPTTGKSEEPPPQTTPSSTTSTPGTLLLSVILTILSLK